MNELPTEPRLVTADEARASAVLEGLVLAGDLLEVARLSLARLKESLLSEPLDVGVVAAVTERVAGLIIQATAVVDLSAKVAQVCETPQAS